MILIHYQVLDADAALAIMTLPPFLLNCSLWALVAAVSLALPMALFYRTMRLAIFILFAAAVIYAATGIVVGEVLAYEHMKNLAMSGWSLPALLFAGAVLSGKLAGFLRAKYRSIQDALRLQSQD